MKTKDVKQSELLRNEGIKSAYLCPTVLNLVQLSRNVDSAKAGGKESKWNSRSNLISKFPLVTNPFLQLIRFEIICSYIKESFFPLALFAEQGTMTLLKADVVGKELCIKILVLHKNQKQCVSTTTTKFTANLSFVS